jgi:hypothetical protein
MYTRRSRPDFSVFARVFHLAHHESVKSISLLAFEPGTSPVHLSLSTIAPCQFAGGGSTLYFFARSMINLDG